MQQQRWVLWLCLIPFTLQAQTASEQLQQKLQAIQTMSAAFKQVVKAKGRDVSHSQGTMALAKPNQFRWHIKEPMEQLIVADGKRLWVYDVELEQVTVKSQQKNTQATVALFLSEDASTVKRDFFVQVSRGLDGEVFKLKAVSEKTTFPEVVLAFKKESLKRIELLDKLGQRTEVQLSQVKNNQSLDRHLFEFTPPKHVDVVQQ